MFKIEITPEARILIASEAEARGLESHGIAIYRLGPKADLTRSENGEAVWSIERGPSWKVRVGAFKPHPDLEWVTVDGIRVFLMLLPGKHEAGAYVAMRVAVRGGRLYIEQIDV